MNRVLHIVTIFKAVFVVDKHSISLSLEALKILTNSAWILAILKFINIAKKSFYVYSQCIETLKVLCSAVNTVQRPEFSVFQEGIRTFLSQPPTGPYLPPPRHLLLLPFIIQIPDFKIGPPGICRLKS